MHPTRTVHVYLLPRFRNHRVCAGIAGLRLLICKSPYEISTSPNAVGCNGTSDRCHLRVRQATLSNSHNSGNREGPARALCCTNLGITGTWGPTQLSFTPGNACFQLIRHLTLREGPLTYEAGTRTSALPERLQVVAVRALRMRVHEQDSAFSAYGSTFADSSAADAMGPSQRVYCQQGYLSKLIAKIAPGLLPSGSGFTRMRFVNLAYPWICGLQAYHVGPDRGGRSSQAAHRL